MITNVLQAMKFTIMDMSQFKSFCYVLFLIISLLTNLSFLGILDPGWFSNNTKYCVFFIDNQSNTFLRRPAW